MSEKIRVAVFGSCLTREIFNSEHIPDWKENFEVTTTRFQNSIISMMSIPVPYSRKIMPYPVLQKFWSGTVLQNCIKDWMNVLTANPPTVLIMDFWGDILGVFKLNKMGSYLPACKGKLRSEENNLLDQYDLDEISIEKNRSRFMKIWKSKFKQFLKWKEKYLPDTHLIINGKFGGYYEKYSDGSIVEIDKEKVMYYNECVAELFDYARKYNIEVVSFDDSKFYRNPYTTKSLAHFTNDYYEYFYSEIKKRCEKYKGIVLESTTNDNLLVNSDFRHGTLFWKTYMKDMKIKNNSVSVYGDGQNKNKSIFMWSNDIELTDYNREVTVSFECRVENPEAMEDNTIFRIRTFNKRNKLHKSDSVEDLTIKYDPNAKAGEFYLYKFSFVPKGKVICVAPFSSGQGNIEWKNMKVNTGGYSPWNISLVEQSLIPEGQVLADFNNPPVFCYKI